MLTKAPSVRISGQCGDGRLIRSKPLHYQSIASACQSGIGMPSEVGKAVASSPAISRNGQSNIAALHLLRHGAKCRR
jgi:hypothetical protein